MNSQNITDKYHQQFSNMQNMKTTYRLRIDNNNNLSIIRPYI